MASDKKDLGILLGEQDARLYQEELENRKNLIEFAFNQIHPFLLRITNILEMCLGLPLTMSLSPEDVSVRYEQADINRYQYLQYMRQETEKVQQTLAYYSNPVKFDLPTPGIDSDFVPYKVFNLHDRYMDPNLYN